jgi:hypothetical protein
MLRQHDWMNQQNGIADLDVRRTQVDAVIRLLVQVRVAPLNGEPKMRVATAIWTDSPMTILADFIAQLQTDVVPPDPRPWENRLLRTRHIWNRYLQVDGDHDDLRTVWRTIASIHARSLSPRSATSVSAPLTWN